MIVKSTSCVNRGIPHRWRAIPPMKQNAQRLTLQKSSTSAAAEKTSASSLTEHPSGGEYPVGPPDRTSQVARAKAFQPREGIACGSAPPRRSFHTIHEFGFAQVLLMSDDTLPTIAWDR